MTADDRFQAVKEELDGLLAERIGALMGIVRASRELVADVRAVDREIRAADMRRATAEECGDTASVGDLDRSLADLHAQRDALVERLEAVSASAR